VADVTPDSPADKAGIKRGDVIISFDGNEITEMKDLPYMVGATAVNKKVTMEVIRKGKKKSFDLAVGELKEEKELSENDEPETDLGMTVEEITSQMARNFGLSETKGLIIVQVQRNSPAAEAGLQQGDIILEVDQNKPARLSDFHKMIRKYKKGDTILFLIKRGESTIYLTLKIEE